jgi:4-diphosphocytidyl-2-C-methyl-D-erythritol kinase
MRVDLWHRGFKAPAKINLFLHIIGRRDDGYHLLQSIFALIDLCDDLFFLPRSDGQIVLGNPIPSVAPESDLVYRAAMALKQHAGQPDLAATIHVTKRIPMGGGLGGGSSDAATTLIALNAIWGLGYSPAVLAQIGVKLGADVPFFIALPRGYNAAFVQGIGEQIEPLRLPVQGSERIFVVKPACSVATATVFSAPNLTRNSKPVKISDFVVNDAVLSPAAVDSPLQTWHSQTRNDLEPVVVERFSPVAEAIQALKGIGLQARMSGSGACVFALCSAPDSVANSSTKAAFDGFMKAQVKDQAQHPWLEQAWTTSFLAEHPATLMVATDGRNGDA